MQTEKGALKKGCSGLYQSLRMVAAAACLWPALADAGPPNPTGSDVNRNTAAGKDALLNVTGTGVDNTAIGYFALKNTTTGGYNTGSGSLTLYYNTTGFYNTASGYAALLSNTTGVRNTATGYAALSDNTTGNWNTANGYLALYGNIGGGFNTATGYQALNRNTNGGYNTAGGTEALFKNTTGGYNTGFGAEALYSNVLGSNNTVIGAKALRMVTQSTNNVALGFSALTELTSGNGNVALGAYAGHLTKTGTRNIYIGTGVGGNGESQVTRIGSTQTSAYIAGISGVPLTGATVVVNSSGRLGVVASSARYKEDIKRLAGASERLARLRPVSFSYKTEPGATHYGLVAEEVDKVMPELVVRDDQGRPESVQYGELIPLLLAERQELQAELREMQAELAGQRALIEQQAATLVALRQTIDAHITALDQARREDVASFK